MFCREAIRDLEGLRDALAVRAVEVVLVHQGTDEQAQRFVAEFGGSTFFRIADPDLTLYRTFDLRHGTLRQSLGLTVWLDSLRPLSQGIFQGRVAGDPWMMPGCFMVYRAKILASYPYEVVSERPNYLKFIDAALQNNVAELYQLRPDGSVRAHAETAAGKARAGGLTPDGIQTYRHQRLAWLRQAGIPSVQIYPIPADDTALERLLTRLPSDALFSVFRDEGNTWLEPTRAQKTSGLSRLALVETITRGSRTPPFYVEEEMLEQAVGLAVIRRLGVDLEIFPSREDMEASGQGIRVHLSPLGPPWHWLPSPTPIPKDVLEQQFWPILEQVRAALPLPLVMAEWT